MSRPVLCANMYIVTPTFSPKLELLVDPASVRVDLFTPIGLVEPNIPTLYDSPLRCTPYFELQEASYDKYTGKSHWVSIMSYRGHEYV